MEPSLQILLVGNYPPDAQQSMLRFGNLMESGLRDSGGTVTMTFPLAVVGRLNASATGVRKWLRYFDKYLVFPMRLRKNVKEQRDCARATGRQLIVHVCDHSNSMYVSVARSLGVPVVITCHDLGAVRGALGEATSCPASPMGRVLQQWIARGLGQANAIVCVSTATRKDVERLIRTPAGELPDVKTVLLGQNAPYSRIASDEVERRLTSLADRLPGTVPFILNVGSSLTRKNRDGVLRIFARVKESWPGNLVFAGEQLSPDLTNLIKELKLEERVLQVENPSDAVLEALYNEAFALLFPSKFEGFGWPVIEAQACGCPVLCSDAGSLPEVVGGSAFVRPWQEEGCFSAEILRLAENEHFREQWVELGFENAKRFTTARMIEEYMDVYRELIDMPEDAHSQFAGAGAT